MPYEAKNFEHLLGLAGFSETLLKNHFTLYQGYVANVNKIAEKSETLEPGSPEASELRRRFGWEWNGMRLHELYFGNMKKNAMAINPNFEIQKHITERFGTFEKFKNDFLAAGAMRGIGWVVLVADKADGRLFTVWVNEHDVGHLAGLTPLLVMDVFEHAYILDYGIKRADYLTAFWQAIDWNVVEERLTK